MDEKTIQLQKEAREAFNFEEENKYRRIVMATVSQISYTEAKIMQDQQEIIRLNEELSKFTFEVFKTGKKPSGVYYNEQPRN